MSFHFDTLKAVQAVAVMLKHAEGKKHNYTAIVKMLYIADRESIQEAGMPITGDKPYALERGPILSLILDLIKDNQFRDEEQRALWSKYILRSGYDIELVLDPGDDELSDFEVQKLEKVFQEHGKKEWVELVDETHRFAEWKESYTEGTTNEIHLNTLLKALDMEDRYDELSTKQIEDAHFAKLFGA